LKTQQAKKKKTFLLLLLVSFLSTHLTEAHFFSHQVLGYFFLAKGNIIIGKSGGC